MKKSTKVILGVGGVAVLGFVTYLALRPKTPRNNTPHTPTPPPPPPPSQGGGGNNIDLYVKTFDDILGIFNKPSSQVPSSSVGNGGDNNTSTAGYF